MRRILRRAPVVLVVLLAGCTVGDPPPSQMPSPEPTINPVADVAVIRIEQTGGMIPPWETMRWYPTVALYGDGRLVTQGPQLELYPGPALPNLTVTHFSQHGVEQAVTWAGDAGLHGDDRFLGPQILDAGSLVFTVVTPEGTHRTSVTDISADDPAINALRQFQDVMTNLGAWLPDDVASEAASFEWHSLRVISFPSDPQSLPDPNLVRVVDWPLADLATLGVSWSEPAQYRCFELAGDDLATARPIFEAANELTLFRSAGFTYQFYLHPLLPDDEACPGF